MPKKTTTKKTAKKTTTKKVVKKVAKKTIPKKSPSKKVAKKASKKVADFAKVNGKATKSADSRRAVSIEARLHLGRNPRGRSISKLTYVLVLHSTA